jgi:hypothetical protein
MNWCAHIYAGKKAALHRHSIISALKKGKPCPGVYVLTRAVDSDGILDIYHSAVILSGFYRDREITVIGIAMGRREAMEVARLIVDDMYRKNGDFDIDAYCGIGHS